jgi:methylenetetrahydrofolate--tRNA-(uracil-5-)-methyltransferase
MGLLAGINTFRRERGMNPVVPPPTTAIGALIHYITHSQTTPFQPMNINFGLFPPLAGKVGSREKRRVIARRALEAMEEWMKEYEV